VNGDKLNDLVFGSSVLQKTYTLIIVSFYVILGKHDSNTLSKTLLLNPSTIHRYGFRIAGNDTSLFGYTLSGVGDLNRDGYSDLAVGDRMSNSVWIIFGSKVISDIFLDDNFQDPRLLRIYGKNPKDMIGTCVKSAGDMNGDGYLDLAVCGAAASYIIYGRKKWEEKVPNDQYYVDQSFTQLVIAHASVRDIVNAGDVNHDGLNDLLIYGFQSERGFVLYGQRHIPMEINPSNLGTKGVIILGKLQYNLPLFSFHGDFDHDGINDFFISSGFSHTVSDLQIFFVSGKTFIEKNFVIELPIVTFPSFPAVRSFTGIGDYNGDGVDDIVGISSAFKNNISQIAYISFGRRVDLFNENRNTSFPEDIVIYDKLDTLFSWGYSIFHLGDINQDGLADFGLFIVPYFMSEVRFKRILIIFGRKDTKLNQLHLYDFNSMAKVAEITNNNQTWNMKSNTYTNTISKVTSCDFDGDSSQDIVLVLFQSSVNRRIVIISGKSILPGNRIEIAILSTDFISFDLPSGLSGVEGIQNAGDIDGDGCDELLYAFSRDVYLAFGGKSTIFSRIIPRIVRIYSISDPSLALFLIGAAGDMNGDGYDDIAISIGSISNFNSFILLVYGHGNISSSITKGNSSLVSIPSFVSSSRFTSFARIDLNRDGYSDLIAADRDHIRIFYGESSFHSIESLRKVEIIATMNEVKVIGDYDNDTYPDFTSITYFIPGIFFNDFMKLPSNHPSKKTEIKFSSENFYQMYIKGIIQELLFLIGVLIMGIIVFVVFIGYKKPVHRKKSPNKLQDFQIIELTTTHDEKETSPFLDNHFVNINTP
jgi:hypothetical protein